MIIYIKDLAYRQRIKTFIRQNFNQYGVIELLEEWRDEYLDSDFILTDDNDLLVHNLPKIYYLSEQVSDSHLSIYKYQRFDQILNHIPTLSKSKTNIDFRIIAVTSLLGGAGKTKLAHSIIRNLNCHYRALYLPLLSPESTGITLSDLAFELSFGGEVPELNFRQDNSLLMLNGFKSLSDLVHADFKEILSYLRDYLLLQGISALVIDAGNYYFSNLLADNVRDIICVRDYQRQTEEERIVACYNQCLKSGHFLINKHPLAKEKNHLPLLTNIENEMHVFDNVVRNYLKEEGWIGY